MYDNKKAFQQSNCTIAVLPLGAVEQHGSHLPVGTDTLIAGELAARVAKQLDAFLLPTLPITSSIEHRETKGTVYIKAITLAAMIRDIAESLEYSGFTKLYLINGHGGNWIVKPTIRQLNRDLQSIDVVQVSTASARVGMRKVMDHLENDVHAGEAETSIMLHLHKEYVDPVLVKRNREFVPQDFLDYFDIADITDDGYWGYPESATAEKGERWLEMLTAAAMDYIRRVEVSLQQVQGKRSFESK
jgi:creatinine amidohydrolase